MAVVELDEQQQQLRRVIEENLRIARNFQSQSSEITQQAFQQMKTAAHELHMQLEPKPTHHRYMIENRGMQSDHPEFYNHIHPVEDLLTYLDDTSANDDPIDHTLGDVFEFRLYSNRYGHYDNYQLTRTIDGWHTSVLSYNGEDRLEEEMNVLYSAMRHDSISFPRNVDSYMTSIWTTARDQGLEHDQVQELLNRVAHWISETEINAPTDILI